MWPLLASQPQSEGWSPRAKALYTWLHQGLLSQEQGWKVQGFLQLPDWLLHPEAKCDLVKKNNNNVLSSQFQEQTWSCLGSWDLRGCCHLCTSQQLAFFFIPFVCFPLLTKIQS